MPPLLSFLGSGEFAVMTRVPVADAEREAAPAAIAAVATASAATAPEPPQANAEKQHSLDRELWLAVEAQCSSSRVAELAAEGANACWPNPDWRDEPALIVACQKGNADVVAALLAAGADVNARNRFGVTALTCAAFNGHVAAVALLLAVPGVNVGARDDDGTALEQAQGQEVRALLVAAVAATATHNLTGS